MKMYSAKMYSALVCFLVATPLVFADTAKSAVSD